jgi:hypothetical protein
MKPVQVMEVVIQKNGGLVQMEMNRVQLYWNAEFVFPVVSGLL